ncbi:MAG: putative collagen-binding domain-containing protein, partial [bacterium]
MGAMKKMMEKFDWFDLIPAQELLIDADLHVNASGHANLPVAKNDRYVLAYFPAKTASATLAICGALPTDTYSWLSPRDGAEFFRSPVGSNTQLTLSPPDSSDWLLVIESTSISILPGNCIELENEIADTEIKLLGNIPNPFHRKTQIVYQVGRPGTAMIEIFDLLGREIFREHYTLA